MTPGPSKSRTWLANAPAVLAGAAAVATMVSIAAYEILLGAAVVALLAQRKPWRSAPVAVPLAAFLAWTLVSIAASPDPRGGLPQVKKMFVYLMLFVVLSAVQSLREVTWIAYGWSIAGVLSSLLAAVQFEQIRRSAHGYFINLYINDRRATGFLGHWMTLSGVLTMALMLTSALLLFGTKPGKDGRIERWRLAGAVALMSLGLGLTIERTYWAGAVAGLAWLLWSRKWWLVSFLPVGLGVVLAVSPFVRTRVMDLFQPQPGVLDSKGHRAALRAAGWEMVVAHPITGIGPEQVPKRFFDYAPPEVPRPFPKDWSIQHLHNIYYQYAAERGLPALAAFLWLLGRILRDFLRSRKHAGDGRWVLEGAIAATIGMMVAGFGEANFNDSEPLGMFLAMVACGYTVRGIRNDPVRIVSS